MTHKNETPILLSRAELSELANKAFSEVVDWDFAGNPITDYDVLLYGAYGPAVARLVNAALQKYGSSNVLFEEPPEDPYIIAARRINKCRSVLDVKDSIFRYALKNIDNDENSHKEVLEILDKVNAAFQDLAAIV